MFKCSVTGVRKLLKINMGFAKLGEKNKLLAKMSVSTWRNFRVSILKNILHCITPMKVDCWMRSNELGLWSLQLLRGKGKDTLCWDGSDEWQRLTVDIFFDAWFPSSFSGMALFFFGKCDDWQLRYKVNIFGGRDAKNSCQAKSTSGEREVAVFFELSVDYSIGKKQRKRHMK